MTNDLVKWLRGGTFSSDETKTDCVINAYRHKAADCIEQLTADLAAEREWRPMATAPTDGTLILAALRVFNSENGLFSYLDVQAVSMDEDGDAITACGDHSGWRWEDFEVWKPIDLAQIDLVLGGGDE